MVRCGLPATLRCWLNSIGCWWPRTVRCCYMRCNLLLSFYRETLHLTCAACCCSWTAPRPLHKSHSQQRQMIKLCCSCYYCKQESLANGKHLTAVRVWRPLAQNSTANQWYTIYYCWLIVNVAILLTVCKIFLCIEIEKSPYLPTVFWLYTPQQYQRSLYIAEKYI